MGLPAQEQEKAKAATDKDSATEAAQPEPGEYNNSITFGIGDFFVSGDKAQFMRQQQLPSGTFGGLEELHLEQELGKRGLLKIDGRAIFENNDYLIKLDLSHPDKGFVRAGYQEFRTWYDGSGGFSSRSNAWITLYDEELHIDRGDAWIEAGLTLPDWPVFTVRYDYLFREGQKDSTIWGDYNLNAGFAGAAVVRGIVPTFLDIDEKRHVIQGDAKHTLGKTDIGLGVRYEASDLDNSRNIRRRPGDATVTRTVTQNDTVDSDLFNVRGSSETRFNEKLLFTMGGAFTRLDTDIGGSRIYGPTYGSPLNPTYANRQARDEGFYDLAGGSRSDQYVANLNLMYTPWKHFAVVPALRVEHQERNGVADFTEINIVGTNLVSEPLINTQVRRFTEVTEGLEARYTGFKNWSLYARGEWVEGQGELKERETENDDVGLVDLERDTDSKRLVQKYSIGANWYPHRKVSLGSQYYYKDRRNDYDHNVDSAAYTVSPTGTNISNFYPAFIRRHEFDTHDVNFRVTWRLLPSLTLVSRYDFQLSTFDTLGGTFGNTTTNVVRLKEVESAEAVTHIFGESISWNPLARLYLQGNISYVLDETETPASELTGAAANLVQNAENDYWNASLLIGYALSDKSDLLAQYTYYRADNYADNSSVSLPYGAGEEQHGVTATFLHRLRKNLLWKLQYGFFTGHSQTYGGNNDYNAHLVYSSVQYSF